MNTLPHPLDQRASMKREQRFFGETGGREPSWDDPQDLARSWPGSPGWGWAAKSTGA